MNTDPIEQLRRLVEETSFGMNPSAMKLRDVLFVYGANLPAILAAMEQAKARNAELEKVVEAARKVAKHGRWVPAGADNYDYLSMVNGVVGTDWNELVAALAALDKEGGDAGGQGGNG